MSPVLNANAESTIEVIELLLGIEQLNLDLQAIQIYQTKLNSDKKEYCT